MLWGNHKLSSDIGTLRNLLQFAKTGETEVTGYLRGRVVSALKVLDRHMQANDFVAAPRLTVADFSLCGYLFWPAEYGVTWDDYPGIGSWLARLRALEGWVHSYELMPGHTSGIGD